LNSYTLTGVPSLLSHLLDQLAALGDTARQLKLALGHDGDPAKKLGTGSPALLLPTKSTSAPKPT
jgi:hypothetical protein